MGQAGFFAIGGYASSFIATRNLEAFASSPILRLLDLAGLLSRGTDPYGKALLSLSPWVACVAALLLAAATAALIGRPVLKLKGHYLAMATLGFGLVVEKIVRGTKAFGGADGLSNVPGLPILPGLAVEGGRAARAQNFTIAFIVLALALLALVNLFGSRAGRALRALHDGEEAADAMGVDTSRYKLNVFILGAVYAALAGILLTHYNGSIGPGEANVMKSVRYVAIVAVGGMANLTGTLAAGLVLNFLSLRGVFGSLDDLVFGAILIVVMLFGPAGEGGPPQGWPGALPARKRASMSLLEVSSLSRSFGGLRAVDSVSFAAESDHITAIIGPNGAGKTTLFNLIAGSLAPDSGDVRLEGADITGLKPFRVARRGISRTFQAVKLSSRMTALENVMLGRHVRSRAGFASGMLAAPWAGREERSIREEAMKAIELLGIADYRDRETGGLPFGIQRSVELARAIASEPKLLLLDEPASGLNVRETKALAELIARIRGGGMAILVVEHDMSLVMDISDEIVVLNFGKKIAQGEPRQIQANREVIDIYLGEDDA